MRMLLTISISVSLPFYSSGAGVVPNLNHRQRRAIFLKISMHVESICEFV